MNNKQSHNINKVTLATLIVTLGVIYGDIGTSPLYVMSAIIRGNSNIIDLSFVLGGVSLVIWTLTLQTTIKYVFLTLNADNNGEGGIFSLYTIIRKRAKWLLVPAVIGGSALLADGMITPPVTVTSAIEGLVTIIPLETDEIVIIVAIIITVLFLFQRFGTAVVGRVFGPVMTLWFFMLAVLGVKELVTYPEVIKAINPYYGIKLLITNPLGIMILGAVFLCTTGAEALYSDLGHCGKKNIHYTWVYVKISLILNYLGQAAWLSKHDGQILSGNPFYNIMPSWFLIPGIIISTLAAIIASQALISGSFTLVSEAIKLNIFPRLNINYPSDLKGQLYIPAINTVLWLGCMLVLFHFKKSSNMEAAYGLSITITMLMTTVLFYNYLRFKQYPVIFSVIFLCVYGTIEGIFLYANLFKFFHGGYITVLIGLMIMFLMYVWIRGKSIKEGLAENVQIKLYEEQLTALQEDVDIPKYATNLVYLTNTPNEEEVERKVMYSILNKQPKRAEIYWFINVLVTDEPFTMEYKVNNAIPNQAIKIQFRLGFKVDQRINVFLRQIVNELLATGELNPYQKGYFSESGNQAGDFKFVIIQEALSNEGQLPKFQEFIMNLKLFVKKYTVTPAKWFGLDTSNVEVETVPLVLGRRRTAQLTRVN
ncbi:potassium transport protein Kup [Sebaldella termitidis]|uniref:Probable potassium transport system protein Kup n=1 Tax=Sebaldella termitidis (strain ATCC 33386 / NCTC 11300) TaxID=526218 RepID=D1AJJ1_SEBTE|nr:KUP/HAK/KT family potassium transporter [Sebaldella termitidis]ACZ08879.1 K potassium transporter [Sebaldella termitidis ATCC 33386]SUI24199.1 potassium transport protein Kup [Sebaldella termitidis]